MKKLLVSLVTGIALSLTLSSAVDAESDKSDLNYDYINDRYITDVYEIDENGNKVKVPFEEFMEVEEKSAEIRKEISKLKQKSDESLKKMKLNEMTSSYSTLSNPGTYYRYTEEASGKFRGRGYKETAEFACPWQSPGCSQTYTVSHSQSVNWGSSVLAGQQSSIAAGASFNWSYTASSSESYTLNLAPGQTGWIEVAPYWNYTGGTSRKYVDGLYRGSSYVYAESPSKLYNGDLEMYVYGVVQ